MLYEKKGLLSIRYAYSEQQRMKTRQCISLVLVSHFAGIENNHSFPM